MDALGGLRVLDLSRGLAGTLATHLLADYGAEVIRIEPPEGDPLRREAGFPFWGRGKQSVVLDLHAEQGREQARLLAARSDVLVETFRPGVATRLGLDYEQLAGDNPALVYGSITGFGRSGRHAALPGYEGLVMARMGGMAQAASVSPRPGPTFPAMPYASFGAAQTLLQGVLAALYVRERTGRGQRVDATLAQGIAANDPWDWFLHLVAERYPAAFATAPPTSKRGVPQNSMLFRLLVCLTKDGHWLQFSQTSPHLFQAFMEALGLDWMFSDPEWSSAPEFEDEDRREAFWVRMLEAARTKTYAEWQKIFDAEPNVWAEEYRRPRQLLDHAQMRHDGNVIEVDDPAAGATTQIGPMVRMDRTPGRVRAPAARLGQHTDEVLARVSAEPARAAAPASAPAPTAGPLEGVTVLELGSFYAAPFGPAVLADLGARVIKVEPLSGEPMRNILPFPEAGAVKALQGKESVAVDVARAEGMEVVRRLAARADLLMTSYRAGVAAKHGFDSESLREVNPDLVYLYSPGYGIDGPCGGKPAFAPTIGAATGIGRLQAGPSVREGPDLELEEIRRASLRLGQAAMSPGNADGVSALGVATALLLGLVARQRTGVGQELRTSMLCTTAHALSAECIEYTDRPPAREPDPELLGFSSLYRLYECAEGWVFLAEPRERAWPGLCEVLAPWVDLAGDGRFADPKARQATTGELSETLAAVFRQRPAAQWQELFVAAGLGLLEVAGSTIPKVTMDDPELRAAGFLAEVEHPTFGAHRRLAPLARLSDTPGTARPACLLGQHTESVLRELGYADDEIDRLEADGVLARAR